MNILCLGAFSATVTVTLRSEEGTFENRRNIGLKHNHTLMHLTDSVLTEAGLASSELSVVVCTQGPGSFTALRIVMAAAKGLAAGSGASFITVPTFDVIGRMYSFFPGIVAPVLDAKRGRFYTALYKNGERVADEMDIPPHHLLEQLPASDPVLFVGDDPGEAFASADEGIRQYIAANRTALGPYLIDTAETMYKDNIKSKKEVSPLYVRLSDAEMQRRNEHRS